MILALAMALDAFLGEPRAIWSRLPHPAVLMGRAVDALERGLNRGERRRLRGVLAVLLLAGGSAALGWAVASLPGGPLWEVIAAAILLAQRSLVDHLRAVAFALRRSVAAGREAVAMIVGRDTAAMDEAAVARAAIESGAENLSDGVIAPAFWFILGGLPGMLLYKAVNTADSMIGYRTPRHERFGWAAARFDDVLNLVPARLTALLILSAHGTRGRLRALVADASRHRSPNAGWPEAAMAQVLDVALSGPRSYGGTMRDLPWIHAVGRHHLGPEDVDAACRALWRTWTLGLALVVASAALL